MRTILTVFAFLFWLSSAASGVEICLSEQDAARLILEYERGQFCKAEVSEWRQYSDYKEAELRTKDDIILALKEQVEKDEKIIRELKGIALKPKPKFELLLSPAFYVELRTIGTLSSPLIQGGVKMDILKAQSMIFYSKVEGSYRDDTKSTNFGVYVGAEWRPW